MNLKAWIHKARELGASDLHVEAGTALVVRIRGELRPIGEAVPQTQLELLGKELLGAESWAQFGVRGSADVSTAIAGVRCRISFYRTVRGTAIAVRLLAPSVNDLRACNLHPDLRRLVDATTGLVVISGPTGSGKSTTLAALVEEINSARSRHIITLESPLEYLFSNRRSYIRQREIPTHAPTFEQAIVDALRENPDVLVIGEMRTPEVMRLTLNAAETGHLVLATMHSATCAEALNRMCMSFPAELQGNIRAQLADCLVGVLCQRLDFLEAHHLLVPRCELLLASTAARGTIRAGQFSNLANVIQSGGEDGMWSFERYQRWMQQNRAWMRAPVAPPPAPAPPAPAAVVERPAAAPADAAGPAQGTAAPGEITIEEDMDLEELAALARQIEQRTS
ncbi:MAG TPA: ATPase, T2SS/T4P/T4SS family [Steroidobacteraceae bacterium]|nr:ATPase, T2SS/T4P/T4SS family [Steroidobacteraceae bacterium]